MIVTVIAYGLGRCLDIGIVHVGKRQKAEPL
jgi:hypothetical protein